MIPTKSMAPPPSPIMGILKRQYYSYADDILIFTKANQKSLGNIKEALKEFTKFSRLEFNQAMCTTTYSKVCACILFCPSREKKKTHGLCWKLIQPIEELLAKCKNRCLSFARKTQLVIWIPLSKFQYWAQCTTLPGSSH